MINTDYFISRSWRLNFRGEPEEVPLSRETWIHFVEDQKDFVWSGEATADSAEHNGAFADFDKKKGFYKFALHYRTYGFVIDAVFNEMRPNRARLILCLELAEELGAHLFRISAKKPVTREWIELKYPEKKKAE